MHPIQSVKEASDNKPGGPNVWLNDDVVVVGRKSSHEQSNTSHDFTASRVEAIASRFTGGVAEKSDATAATTATVPTRLAAISGRAKGTALMRVPGGRWRSTIRDGSIGPETSSQSSANKRRRQCRPRTTGSARSRNANVFRRIFLCATGLGTCEKACRF